MYIIPKKISYSKEFTNGPLKGLTVHPSFNTTDDAVDATATRLRAMSFESSLRDTITGDRFRISNVAVTEVTQ